MGWLRQLMNEAQPKIGSFDRLAGRLIGHPDWPRDSRTQLRSLGALLSKLDRGTELEWLADRVHVQHIAAEVLGCPLSSIQARLGARLSDADRQLRRFRFDEVRFARPLELVEEALPPGFPRAVQQPGSWQGLWWHAPSGSGRSLLGRWLEARGLARVEVATHGDRALQLLNEVGGEPLFIELLGDAGPLAAAVPPQAALVCIACAEPPQHAAWQVVRAPAVATYLKALVAWLVPRLPKDGNFQAEAALRWLHAQASGDLLDNFGTALGLLGLVDEFGSEKLANRPLPEVARAFITEKLKLALSRGSNEAQWLGERGFEVLVGMAERTLGSGNSWQAVRSETAWLALVPEEFRHGVDGEWARMALSKAVSRSAAKELESALQKVQPGAFRIVRALRAAGLLRPQGEGLCFAPHWLARAIEAEAFQTLLDSPAFHWGEALLAERGVLAERSIFAERSILAERSQSRIVAALHQRFLDEDFSALEDLLELDAPQNPAYAAAVEGCFYALGLALAKGVAVPQELLTGLWEEQQEIIVQIGRDALPKPRIVQGRNDAMLQLGAFYLAALAISAELPERGAARHPVLHPWAERVVDSRFETLLTEIARWLHEADGPNPTQGRPTRGSPELGTPDEDDTTQWRQLTVRQVDRLAVHLAERFGAASSGAGKTVQGTFVDALGEPHPLEWPSLLLREMKSGPLDARWLERLARDRDALSNVHALCAAKPDLSRQVGAGLWQLWSQQKAPEGALRAFCARGEWLWPVAPVECLLAAIEQCVKLELPIHFQRLTAEQWQHLHDAAPTFAFKDEALWLHAPSSVAWHWLGSDAARLCLTEALSILWQRDPVLALKQYDVALQHDLVSKGSTAVHLLGATPREHRAALFPWLKGAVSKPGATIALVDAARRFLHEQVAQRAAGFREAYALLDELERRSRRTGA